MDPIQKNGMKTNIFLLTVAVWAAWTMQVSAAETTGSAEGSEPSATQVVTQTEARAAFQTIIEVLKSPRCMNCHPTDDVPRQGEDQHPHLFAVERGPADQGWEVQTCATCHREENNEYTGIPGAPHWGLAPRSMGWLGLPDAEIARRLMDPEENGGRSAEELVHHMSEDALVLWAWQPGEGRQPPSVSLDEFRAALQTWLRGGAPIEAP